MGNIHSVTLYTTSIVCNIGDKWLAPKKWEKVKIPDYIWDTGMDYILVPMYGVSDATYLELQADIAKSKAKWLKELNDQGYTAVTITLEDDGFSAEVTRESFKR